MRIAIIGSTGNTGRELVQQALGHGHEVRALVPQDESLGLMHERLSVVTGEIASGEGVAETVKGSLSVLFCVEEPAGHESVHTHSDGVHHTIAAMRMYAADRLVALSASGVGAAPEQQIPLVQRFFGKRPVPNAVKEDMERMEYEIMLSDVNWTIVRPPRLTEGPLTGEYRVVEGRTLVDAKELSRADLAAFMLKTLGVDLWDSKGVAIGY